MESLFSFGFYVEHIMGWPSVSSDPTVAFRLFDYPTVAVQCSPVSKENMETNERNEAEGQKKYWFHKGKSCLFKYHVEDLSRVIKQIPLYVMVFDSKDRTSQLKGCCSIPLRNLYHDIERKLGVSGHDAPVTSEETGLFVVYDLMGIKTGELKLQLKLNFYGTSLLKHANDGYSVGGASVTAPLGSLGTYLDLNNNNDAIDNSTRVKPLFLSQAVETKIVQCDITSEQQQKQQQQKQQQQKQQPQRLQQQQKQHSQQEQLQQQEQLHHQQMGLVHDRQQKKKNEETVDVLHNTNVYCPPPLFLNFYVTNVHQNSGSKKSSCDVTDVEKLSALRNRYGTPDSNLSIVEPYKEILRPVENRNSYKVQSDSGEIDKRNEVEETEITNKEPQQGASLESSKGSFSKFPLLSALSSEILTLVNFLNENDTSCAISANGITESVQNAEAQASTKGVNDSDKIKEDLKDALENSEADNRPRVSKNGWKKVPNHKDKLRFKTTRAQKLRSKYNTKHFKPKTNDRHLVETNSGVEQNVENDHMLIFETVDATKMKDFNRDKIVDDVSSIQSTKQEMQHQVSQKGIHSVAKESRSAQTTPVHITELTPRSWQKKGPGFPLDHQEVSLPRPTSSAKRRERSSRSGAQSRCSAPSRNLESSIYAFDTFSSEDAEDEKNQAGSRSSSFISETSSISLPLSREVSEKSISSKGSVKSRCESRKLDTRQTTRSLPEASVRSDKSVLNRSHSDNRLYSEKETDSIPHNLPSSVKSDGSKKGNHPSRSSSEKYSMLNKEKDIEVKEKDDEEHSINSSMLDSVNLERYQGDDSTTTFQASTEKNTNDMIDDSRPATQASVNTIPEDSVFSPQHISSADMSESVGSPVKDRNMTPTDGVLPPKELISRSISPDNTRGMRPNNSTHSPRKSKHTAPTFQMSKRTHGLGKLEERPSSELSGDTTMREIDMFIGDELTSAASGGSSFIMTTDENVSPVLSSSLTRFKPGLNKFDSRQVETVEEVDVKDEIEKKEEGDQVMPMRRSSYVDVDVPMTSDFSPAQSKLFAQKKKYDNVFRESLPHFSSNTNESSNEGFL